MRIEVDEQNRQWRSVPAVELQVRLRECGGKVWRIFLLDDGTSYAELHKMLAYLFGYGVEAPHQFCLSRRLHPGRPVQEETEFLAEVLLGRHFSYRVKGKVGLSFSLLVRSHGRAPLGELPVTLAGKGRLVQRAGEAPQVEQYDELWEFNEMQRSVRYDGLLFDPMVGFVERWGFGALRMNFDQREIYCNVFVRDDSEYRRISGRRPLRPVQNKVSPGVAVEVSLRPIKGNGRLLRSLRLWSEMTFRELRLLITECLDLENDEGAFMIDDSLIQTMEEEVEMCAYEEIIDENLIRLRDIMEGPGWQIQYRSDPFSKPMLQLTVEKMGGAAPRAVELLMVNGRLDENGRYSAWTPSALELEALSRLAGQHAHRWPAPQGSQEE